MDLLDFAPLIVSLVGLAFAWAGLSFLHGMLRERRQRRELARKGTLAAGRVVRVEAMDRSLNNAAGHPVLIELTEGADRGRQLRDSSGLGGFLVREGTAVTVRYIPDSPELVRVEEVHGPHGTYRTNAPSPPLSGLLNLAWPIGALCVPIVVALVLVGLWHAPRLIAAVPALVCLVGLGMVTGAVSRGLHQMRGRGRMADTTGTVTDHWTVTRKAGDGPPRTYHPFTVWFVASDGREVHSHSPDASETFAPDIGHRVRVRYDTAHPAYFQVGELGWERGLGVVVPLLVGLLFTLGGLAFTVAIIVVAPLLPT